DFHAALGKPVTLSDEIDWAVLQSAADYIYKTNQAGKDANFACGALALNGAYVVNRTVTFNLAGVRIEGAAASDRFGPGATSVTWTGPGGGTVDAPVYIFDFWLETTLRAPPPGRTPVQSGGGPVVHLSRIIFNGRGGRINAATSAVSSTRATVCSRRSATAISPAAIATGCRSSTTKATLRRRSGSRTTSSRCAAATRYSSTCSARCRPAPSSSRATASSTLLPALSTPRIRNGSCTAWSPASASPTSPICASAITASRAWPAISRNGGRTFTSRRAARRPSKATTTTGSPARRIRRRRRATGRSSTMCRRPAPPTSPTVATSTSASPAMRRAATAAAIFA